MQLHLLGNQHSFNCLGRPKLYFVKVDVQACFDTIEQTKLLGILRDLLSEVCMHVSAPVLF